MNESLKCTIMLIIINYAKAELVLQVIYFEIIAIIFTTNTNKNN